MKNLQLFLLIFGLICGFSASAISSDKLELPPQKEISTKMPHHRAMSLAMMKDLQLSAEQKAQWKQILMQKNSEIEPLRQQIHSLHEKEREISHKYEQKIETILNAEQLQKYKSMLHERKNRDKRPPRSKKPKQTKN